MVWSEKSLEIPPLIFRLPHTGGASIPACEMLITKEYGLVVGTTKIEAVRINRNRVFRNFGNITDPSTLQQLRDTLLAVYPAASLLLLVFTPGHG